MKLPGVAALCLYCLIAGIALPSLAFDDKIEEYKKAIAADPKDYAPHFALGQIYQTLGLYEKAIKEFKETLRLEPIFSAAYHGLGGSYGELGRFKESQAAYLETTRLDPNYAEGQYGLGWVYNKLHKCKKALPPLKDSHSSEAGIERGALCSWPLLFSVGRSAKGNRRIQ